MWSVELADIRCLAFDYRHDCGDDVRDYKGEEAGEDDDQTAMPLQFMR